MKKLASMFCIAALIFGCAFVLPAVGFAEGFVENGAMDEIDLGGVFGSLGGDFDLSGLSGIFDSLGGGDGQTGTFGLGTPTDGDAATDGSSPLDKIKDLFGDNLSDSSSSSSSGNEKPGVSYTARRSEDGSSLAIDFYLVHYVGVSAGTVRSRTADMELRYAESGEDAKKINYVKGNGFQDDVNDTVPGRVNYGFYFREYLWPADEAEYAEGHEDTAPYNSDCFHLATMCCRIIQPGAQALFEVDLNTYRGDTGCFAFTLDFTELRPGETTSGHSAFRGDVDGDGELTSADARCALRASVQLERYEEISLPFWAADVNRDGTIGADDARMLLRASVKLESL